MKHTLTPWRAHINRAKNICQIVVQIDRNNPDKEACIAQVCGPFRPAEVEANARLMGHSPELWQAVKDLLYMECNPPANADEDATRIYTLARAERLIAAIETIDDESVEAKSDTPALTQRALAAHNDSLKAIEIGSHHLIEEARNFAAGFLKTRFEVEVSPADFRITLPVDVECTIAHITIEKLDFQLRFYPDKDYQPAYLQICVDTVLYDVECLADLGAILTRLKLVPAPGNECTD